MMEKNAFNAQQFYSSHGQTSDPGPYAHLLNDLPTKIPDLVKAIQGLMLHLHWASDLGITLNRIRREESNLRTIQDRMEKIIELHNAPLSEKRALSRKTVGTCRDFTLLFTAALRHRGIAARARCGFGTYFVKGSFEDHWVGEYWHADKERWVMVDPQLDPFQIEKLGIDFDPLDMPRTKFVTGGQAWGMCRARRVDPQRFGIFRMRGLDFVKGDMIRDFLALNKIEILPWDNFMLINTSITRMKQAEKDLMDRLARISTGEDQDFVLIRAAFAANQDKLLPKYFQ
ncbi:MAG: transglutaminase-like domain-containing protein [Brevefilum sp.]